jgi:hypothetical protein
MKNSRNKGFDQHYNGQIAVDQQTLLIVANTLYQITKERQQIEHPVWNLYRQEKQLQI